MRHDVTDNSTWLKSCWSKRPISLWHATDTLIEDILYIATCARPKLMNAAWYNMLVYNTMYYFALYRGADKSLARPGMKQTNFSVRMAWISFDALHCRGKKNWWQLASRCCWNRARPWHASELVSVLVGLRTYQHPGSTVCFKNE